MITSQTPKSEPPHRARDTKRHVKTNMRYSPSPIGCGMWGAAFARANARVRALPACGRWAHAAVRGGGRRAHGVRVGGRGGRCGKGNGAGWAVQRRSRRVCGRSETEQLMLSESSLSRMDGWRSGVRVSVRHAHADLAGERADH